jgi:cytochrome c biogenesis protein CcmG, thiol:disulfide interchange protein DsbE
MGEIDRRQFAVGATSTGFLGGMFDYPRVGKPAPPFTIVTFDHRTIKLTDLAWCAPCKVELPMLDAYVRRHRSDDLHLFAVATEDYVPNSKLQLLANALSFPLAMRISGPGYADKGAFTESAFAALIGPLVAAPAPGEASTT